MAYGTHAPFTVALKKSFVELNLTPSDWMQLCRAKRSDVHCKESPVSDAGGISYLPI